MGEVNAWRAADVYARICCKTAAEGRGARPALVSVLAWEASEAQAGGECSGTDLVLLLISAVGAHHLLQRTLVASGWEASQLAPRGPGPEVVLWFKWQSEYKCTQSHCGWGLAKIRCLQRKRLPL